MPTFQINAAHISRARLVPAGSVVTVTPGTGGSARVEYTVNQDADIQNNVATWQDWPKGIIYGENAMLFQERSWIRVTGIVATVSYDINESPSQAILKQFRQPLVAQSPVQDALYRGQPAAIALANGDLKTEGCPQRVWAGAPIPPVPTDGAAHTLDMEFAGKRAFSWVQLIYANYNSAAVANISALRVGASPRHLLATGVEIAWPVPLGTIGGQTAAAIPVARASTKANYFIPGLIATDRIPVKNIARTDSATQGNRPLVRARTRIPAEVQYLPQFGSTFAPAWNASALSNGMKVGSTMVNTDFVTAYPTDNGAYTLTENGGVINPIGCIFGYDVPGKGVLVCLDSLGSGQGTSGGGMMGWPVILNAQSEVLDVANWSVPGQLTVDSIDTMMGLINLTPTAYAFGVVKILSPNDGVPTQAIADAIWGKVLPAADSNRSNNIVTVLITSSPVNSWAAANHAVNEAQNQRALDLAAASPWVIVLDWCKFVADPANPRQLNPAMDVDGTHVNDLAHGAFALFAKSKLE